MKRVVNYFILLFLFFICVFSHAICILSIIRSSLSLANVYISMIRIYTWHSSSRAIVTFKNICILRNFFPISITGSRLNANCSGQTLIPTYFTLRMCVCACVLFDRNRYFIESINTREYFLKLKREKDGRGIIIIYFQIYPIFLISFLSEKFRRNFSKFSKLLEERFKVQSEIDEAWKFSDTTTDYSWILQSYVSVFLRCRTIEIHRRKSSFANSL